MVHGCLNGAAVSRLFIQGYNTFDLSRIDPNKDVMHHMLLDLTKVRRDHAWVHKTEVYCERTLVAYDCIQLYNNLKKRKNDKPKLFLTMTYSRLRHTLIHPKRWSEC